MGWFCPKIFKTLPQGVEQIRYADAAYLWNDGGIRCTCNDMKLRHNHFSQSGSGGSGLPMARCEDVALGPIPARAKKDTLIGHGIPAADERLTVN
jgi:hypothetical protein